MHKYIHIHTYMCKIIFRIKHTLNNSVRSFVHICEVVLSTYTICITVHIPLGCLSYLMHTICRYVYTFLFNIWNSVFLLNSVYMRYIYIQVHEQNSKCATRGMTQSDSHTHSNKRTFKREHLHLNLYISNASNK